MTPHKELLDDVRAAPINEVCSASGHALKVAGAGRAAFKGADGKPVVLHDILLVRDLKANLISLRKLAKAGVSTSTDGARTYKGKLGNRAGEGSASQGECNAVGGVGLKVSARSGETDWATAHRRLGHVAMPLLKQLEKDGAVKVAHIPKKYRSKLGASAIWCAHLGLAAESKGWLLWEPSKGMLFDSRDVKFVEGMMYGGWKKQPETKVSEQMEQITMQLDLTPSVWEEGEEAAAEGGDGEKVQEAPAGGGDDVETSDSTKEAAGSEGGEQQQGKAKLTAGADVAEQQLGNEEALLILPHGYDPDEEDELAYCFFAPAPEEPASMEEALAGPDREKWLVSRDAEYQSLLENGTWDLVVLPEGKKAVQCKVCKLKKSIYGLKQAPRCWYQKLAAVLEEMGFRTSSCDESLFLKGEGEKLVLFLVYVDDILLFSSRMKEIQNVQQQLMKNFKCKTLGEVKYYLGMHVERDLDHRWWKLHQENFIKELGEKYGIENERKVATPLPAELKLVKAAEDEGVEAEEQQQFQSLVGSLLYAAVQTRPDISFSVGQLARVVQNPSEEQVDAAERVVKYLNSHPSIGVQYSASAQVKQKGVEATQRSSQGYTFTLGSGSVSSRSTRSSSVLGSSCEAEIYAGAMAAQELRWLTYLLTDLGEPPRSPPVLYVDNKAMLALCREHRLEHKTKHIALRYFLARELQQRG
ncbi:unnamed protein product [Closterium sp. NIES-54]